MDPSLTWSMSSTGQRRDSPALNQCLPALSRDFIARFRVDFTGLALTMILGEILAMQVFVGHLESGHTLRPARLASAWQ
jgi:hypothetical protein